MTNDEAIANINMIRVAFVDPVTKEQRKLIDDTLDTAIKALEQQPCEDEYIKVPKKALKYRTAGMVAYNAEWLKKHWQMELKVMGIECDDAISREAALEKMADYVASGYADSAEDFEEYSRIICQLPPVTPQKHGKWIFVDKAKEHTHCSECDYGDVDLFDGRPHNYCPRCGAKMQESEEV